MFGSRIGVVSTPTAVICGVIVVGTICIGSVVLRDCGDVDVVVDVAVLVVVGVFAVDATDCLRERPIRFNCADGTPILY